MLLRLVSQRFLLSDLKHRYRNHSEAAGATAPLVVYWSTLELLLSSDSRPTFPSLVSSGVETFHKVAGIIMIITPSTTFLFEQLCLDSGHLRFTRLEKGSDCLETFAPLFCFLCLNGQSVWTLDSPSQQCCGRGAGGGLGGFTVCACVCTHENSLNRSSGRRGYVYTAFDAGEKKKMTHRDLLILLTF